jgi:epoxyqueuosine reductase
LVGCLRCQIACPQNVRFLEWIEGDQGFSEEETNLILEYAPSDHLPLETVKKLERLDLTEYLDVLPRNLRMLLRQKSRHRLAS